MGGEIIVIGRRGVKKSSESVSRRKLKGQEKEMNCKNFSQGKHFIEVLAEESRSNQRKG